MKNMHKGHHGSPNPVDTSALPAMTEDAIASLRFMIEEEKMAGDLYDAFFDQTGMTVFSNIGASEDRHLEALLKQADRAGIDVSDLIALPAGEYADPALQDLFGEMLAVGSLSTDAALAVGREIELADIADLNAGITDVAGTTLVGVYSHLLAGSENHLAAFDLYLV